MSKSIYEAITIKINNFVHKYYLRSVGFIYVIQLYIFVYKM